MVFRGYRVCFNSEILVEVGDCRLVPDYLPNWYNIILLRNWSRTLNVLLNPSILTDSKAFQLQMWKKLSNPYLEILLQNVKNCYILEAFYKNNQLHFAVTITMPLMHIFFLKKQFREKQKERCGYSISGVVIVS